MSANSFDPARVVALDFETYWSSKDYSLHRMGPISYIRDPRFRPQLIGVAGAGVSAVYGEEKAVRSCVSLLEAMSRRGYALVAHNMSGFDGLVFSEHFGLSPERLWDTIGMMHWTGLSRLVSCSHASLCETLGTGFKEAGTVVSDGKTWPGGFSEEEREFFKRYCKADASQCLANALRMLPHMTDDALRFMEITARMAVSPAFVVDGEAVDECIDDLERESADALCSLCDALGLPRSEAAMQKALRSSKVVASLLQRLGVDPPTKVSEAKTESVREDYRRLVSEMVGQGREAEAALLRAEMSSRLPVRTWAFSKTDLEFRSLLGHSDPRVRLLVEVRLGFNSSMPLSRARAFRAMAVDRPVPVSLCAFKAHTSRYTAGSDDGRTDGLQFQNLGKRNPRVKALRKAIKAPEGYAVVACDSSQVEARMLAWLANETELVAQFRDGRDPYSELASQIFGAPADEIRAGAREGDQRLKTWRNVGKTCVLSAGYGVGSAKFARTLLLQGARLGETDEVHEALAHMALSTYRATNPNIVKFWRVCDICLRSLLMEGEGTFGGPDGTFFRYGLMDVCGLGLRVPSIRLPSGFVLRYPDLQERERDDGYGTELVYSRPASRGRTDLVRIYSGLLANNLTQAAAFQLLMWQACRMDEEGIPLHANIHDSFASVVPEKYAEETKEKMERIMSMAPPWAGTCPIACEAEIGKDFTVV